MSTNGRRRWIPIAAYSSIFLILGLGLALTLPAGNEITPAPQASPVGDVTGGGEQCLGERVAFVQSGVFIDIHALAPGADERDLGPKLVGGQVDRLTGAAELTGSCAEGSSLGIVPAVVIGVVIDGGGLDGELSSEGTTFSVSIAAADTTAGGDPEREQLTGGELLSRILLAVAVVIAAARLLGSAFQRIGQPRVIGEITAGILLGPSLLGLVLPEVTAFLFPSSVTGVLGILAQIGLIFFMFLIGLELDRTQIRGSGHTAILISHYSIVIPLVLGVASALLVFPMVGSGTFTGFALFMGAAMAITAFPVLARILTDTGLHKTRIGALAITCAAVDDVTAWCVLAIVVAIVNAAGPMEAVTTIVFSLLFVLGMLFVVRPLADRVMTAHKGRGPLSATVLSFLIVGLFLSAWTTEMIGIHAIFGAFIFGAILPRERGVAIGIIERLEDVTVLVLLPIFFAIVGLSTQIGLVSGRALWLLTGLIIAIAIVGKIGGSIIAGLAAGETLRTSGVIGVLMNARGITEIVILTIGMELGVISPALFTIMVLMALTTTIMTTPLLSRLYPRSMVEREILLEHHRDAARGDYGSRRVMVGVTDPVTARPLVQIAGWLRGVDGQTATVVLASVIAPPGHEQVRANIGEFAETSARAAANLSAVADELDQRNVRSEVVTRIGTDRGEELRLICQQQDIDVIVVGSHLAYLHRAPFGGLVGELLRTAPADVLVAVNAAPVLAPGDGPIGVWLPGEPTDLATLDLAG
ncbi:MAG TPA: cation:proton antiporter, partial [Acidimicrobiia bacterium]|nr:cation:proton antiporter [Acidimicrobiia bacterium]